MDGQKKKGQSIENLQMGNTSLHEYSVYFLKKLKNIKTNKPKQKQSIFEKKKPNPNEQIQYKKNIKTNKNKSPKK